MAKKVAAKKHEMKVAVKKAVKKVAAKKHEMKEMKKGKC